MLLTETVMAKWGSSNKKWYELKGYIFTKWKDEFEVNIKDLSKGANVWVKVECDCKDCTTPINKLWSWVDYLRQVREGGKTYCKKCGIILYGSINTNKTKLKNGKSFEQWCIENNRQDILERWDYNLNESNPSAIGYSSSRKIWIKCPKNIHPSELKSVNDFTNNHNGVMDCKQCHSFAQWGIDNLGEDFLEKYWDYDKNINIDPYKIARTCDKKVYIKCQNEDKSYHENYNVVCSDFTANSSRCPYCNNSKIHPLDSLGAIYPYSLEIWSDKNKKSPYEYAPKSNIKVWWKCLNGKHEDYKRSINDSSGKCNFRCPNCAKENRKGEKHFNWKGGITPLHIYLREKITQWKKESIKNSNYKCIITNTKFDNIHHLVGFSLILQRIINKVKSPIYTDISQYTKSELKLLEDICIELHIKYGLGVCLCIPIHKLFHKEYSNGNNTKEQFKQFVTRLENGEFCDFLKENNLELNINYEVLNTLLKD